MRGRKSPYTDDEELVGVYEASEKNTYTAVTTRTIRGAVPTTLRFTVRNTWATGS